MNDTPAHGNTFHACSYVDNGNGTHDLYCNECGVMVEGLQHTFVDGACSNCGIAGKVTWEFDSSTGTLTISGEGDMDEYSASYMCWVCGDNMQVPSCGTWLDCAFFKYYQLTETEAPTIGGPMKQPMVE